MDIQNNSSKAIFPRQTNGDQSSAITRANEQMITTFANRPSISTHANMAALLQSLTDLLGQLLKQNNPGGGMIAVYGAPINPNPTPPKDGGGIAYPVYGAPVDPNAKPSGGEVRPVYGAPIDDGGIRAIYGAPVATDTSTI